MGLLKDEFNRHVTFQSLDAGKNVEMTLRGELKTPVSLDALNNSPQEWERMTGEKIILIDSAFSTALLGSETEPNHLMRQLAEKDAYDLTPDEREIARKNFIDTYEKIHGNEQSEVIKNLKIEDISAACSQAYDMQMMMEGHADRGGSIASVSSPVLENPVDGKSYATIMAIADTKYFTAENFFPSALKYGGEDVKVLDNPEHLRAIIITHELGHAIQGRLVEENMAQGLSDLDNFTIREIDTDVQSRRVLKGLIPEEEIEIVNAAQDLAAFHGIYRSVIGNEAVGAGRVTHFSHSMKDEVLEGHDTVEGTPANTFQDGVGIAQAIQTNTGMMDYHPEAVKYAINKNGQINYGEMKTMFEEFLNDPNAEWERDQKDIVQNMVREMDILGIKSEPYDAKARQYKESVMEWTRAVPLEVEVSGHLTRQMNSGAGVMTYQQADATNYLFTDRENNVTGIMSVGKDSDKGVAISAESMKIRGMDAAVLNTENAGQIVNYLRSEESASLIDKEKPAVAAPVQVVSANTYGL